MDELIIPASYFYLLYLYVFNDFQIGSLQKIHKFIFFIFQNRAGELIGMNALTIPHHTCPDSFRNSPKSVTV